MKPAPELHAVTALRAGAAALWLGFLACTSTVEPPRSQAALARPASGSPAQGLGASRPLDAPESGGAEPEGDDDLVPHDDGIEGDDAENSVVGELRAHPLDGWSLEHIDQALASDPASLGAISVGSPNAGLLLNAVQAQDGPLYKVVSPSAAWATTETLEYLARAIRAVHQEFPDTRPLMLGDISITGGGPLRPHISHQSGRDVDIGYYYTTETVWYARGTRKNLDLPRTWAFVRALIAETDIDLILIDHSIQRLLIEHARRIGEDPEWLESVFKGGTGLRPIIRHARGHATHIHVRFFNPIAQETARRAYDALVQRKLVPPERAYVQHRVKNGETLGMLAKKYGTTVRAIQNANRLRNTRIRAKAVYAIPVRAPAKPKTDPIRIPPRRVPPLRRKFASSEP